MVVVNLYAFEKTAAKPEVLAALDSWQWPGERKLKACDLVVDNAGSLDDLAREAAALRERLDGLRAERAAAFDAQLAALLAEAAQGASAESDA